MVSTHWIGLAEGVLAADCEGVNSGAQALQAVLRRAWRDWPAAGQFPSPHGFRVANELRLGIGKSDHRQGVVAAWEGGVIVRPCLLQAQWSVEPAVEIIATDDVTAADWRKLEALFVDGFRADERRPQRAVGLSAV